MTASRLIGATLISAALLTGCGSAADNDGPVKAPKVEPLDPSALTLTQIATGFEYPWAIAFLPNGDMLVTEREGRLRIVRDGQLDPTPIANTPTDVLVERQGGYLGVEVDPNFATNRLVYMSYARGTTDENGTALIRARLSDDGSALEDVTTIFDFQPKKQRGVHFGGRIEFIDDDTLLLSLGDGFRWMDESQNPGNHFGTIVRINSDGSVPSDNPFADGTAPEVYSYGHRNVQGLAIDRASGTIYASEHGPKGGDEINVIEPGNNYGWPEITYGVNYDGTIITNKVKQEGMEQPLTYWVPSIAPAALAYYSGDKYPGWEGALVSASLVGMALRVNTLEDGQITGEQDVLGDELFRYREIVQGPDGYLYVATDELEGSIYRLDVSTP